MLICYLDESGNTGRRLDDPGQPIHLIAAVLVREDRVRIMSDRLDALAAAALTTKPLVEYRGQEIFGGTGPWRDVQPRVRIREYAKALSVLGEVDAAVAYASISKIRLTAMGGHSLPNPHLYALQFLTEAIQIWTAGQLHPLCQRVMLVADENHEQEKYAYDLICDMQTIGGPVIDSMKPTVRLDNFVDAIYFTKSDQNRGVQLADLVAFIIRRVAWIMDQPSTLRSDKAVRMLLERYVSPQICSFVPLWP